ncbi:MAG: hypothetical protein SOR95_08180 [Sutterella sp.]|nr:hypothetical protein [Sutterella sp.]
MPITFSDQLKNIRSGELDEELAEALAKCVRAVNAKGGKASLTLKLSIQRSGENGGYLKVSSTYDAKLPKMTPIESILFADDDGILLDDNPRQGRIFDPEPRRVEPKVLTQNFPTTVETIIPRQSTPVVVNQDTGEIITIDHN